jgi:hypothetical protein
MKWKIANSKKHICLITAIILLVGFGSSLLIYLTAEDASDNVLVSEFVHSKKYRHELEAYGGKMNVLADEFVRWFEGLWHGKTLAFTIACISIFISFGFFFIAYHLPTDSESDAQDENHRG